jgi:hypothetical protein
MKNIIFSTAILLFLNIGCKQREKVMPGLENVPNRFINPPLPAADVPKAEFMVEAAKGDTVFYKSGSIILFPPNSFIDKNGEVVSGSVRVTYREFADPVDFYLSGISMSYDSAQKQYSFESFGMCEILAYKDSIPVYVNPSSKPLINFVSKNQSNVGNLYFLDTVQKKWMNKKIYTTTNLNKVNSKRDENLTISPEKYNIGLTKPVKPEKAKKGTDIIKIVIDPASFKELLVYNNLKFEIDATGKNFNPKDSEDEWKDIDLQKGDRAGLYKIKFSNDSRSVTYNVKPVLEGEDYDKALKVFDEKKKEYNTRLNERITSEEKTRQQLALQITRDSLENARIKELNVLIEARNKEILKKNAEFKEAIEKKERQIQDAFKLNNTIRSFSIDGFGVWNCDIPIIANGLTILANFKHTNGNNIKLNSTAVVTKSTNGIASYYGNLIILPIDKDNMIFGVYGGRFAYITYDNYRALKITSATKEQTFVMNVVSKEENNYSFIKKLTMQD